MSEVTMIFIPITNTTENRHVGFVISRLSKPWYTPRIGSFTYTGGREDLKTAFSDRLSGQHKFTHYTRDAVSVMLRDPRG